MNKIVQVTEERLFKCHQQIGDDSITYCQYYNKDVSGADIVLIIIVSIVFGAVINDFFMK